MNELHIYPTSRALRSVSQNHKVIDGFLPTLMRMDEFEQRAILLENKTQIDPLQRILLLKEAANFEAFLDLKLDISLVKFFTKSDALFKFFEELAGEQIGFETLAQADAYAEFGTHLEILERLLENYKRLLAHRGYTDKAFIPNSYALNKGFVQAYEHIEVHLEGYLSYFELELLDNISKEVPLVVHYTTSKFNRKMQERFKDMGIALDNNKHVTFSMTDKHVISTENNEQILNVKAYAVEEREEQIAVAFREIEQMVRSGIPAEKIVLILPDESFKEHFTLFDTHNNLNFAMGYDYSNGRIYKSLEALYRHWQSYDVPSKKLVERYGFKLEDVNQITSSKKVKVNDFFKVLDALGLHDSPLIDAAKKNILNEKEKFNEHVYEKYLHFTKVLQAEELTLKEWLFLWLKSLSKVTIDDIRGGLVTVMGVLETRGISFEAVVIVDFNEGVVPATSSKDQFLNSQVRAFANLPTKNDREALQKQYYKRLLEQAKEAVILYSTSDNKLPSKFLYELGLNDAQQTQAQFDLLYAQGSQLQTRENPKVEVFDATSITWSASRLKTFLDCKRKYYYRYIQKIKAKKEEEQNEGAFLHLLLDHVHKEHASYVTKEQMQKNIDILMDTLIPFEDAQTNYKKLLWKEKLKGFVQTQIDHFNAGWKVVEREKEFQGEIGGLRFKGRIDRIDQNDTHTLVLDYKSGSTSGAQSKNMEKVTDLQMSIYAQMLSTKYQNVNLAFVKLFENGNIEEITALEEKNERLAEVIVELKQTKSFIASQCEDLQKCKWCEFTLMCGRGEYL